MVKYGLTPNGPNIKRLDEIENSIHDKLSEKWGVNTRQNPESYLCMMVRNYADKMAELWEFGEDVYYSMYPAFAEGTNLDNAAQYGGSTREPAAKSFYPIHCTGIDGTVLAKGTMISSATNPPIYLTLTENKELTRNSFNKVKLKLVTINANDIYTVAINGAVYSYSSSTDLEHDILAGIADAIDETNYSVLIDEENMILSIEAKDKTSVNVLILSENITTETVTSIINFSTVDTGDIFIPDGAITNIVKSEAGLLSIVNMNGYIAGRNEETDDEFRRSYIDKIFNRSSMMLESIRSAILINVQGVKSVAPYENATHEYDDAGRPPHSIEIVVDGGDSKEIAQQILEKKAGGINTFGDTTVVINGAYDEDIPISFSRPTKIYTWFHVGITLSKSETLSPNYVDLLKEVIIKNIDSLDAGSDVVPQQFMSEMYKACSGISYIDINIFASSDPNAVPIEYSKRSVEITARQRAYTTEDMIEVDIDG